MTAKVVVLDYGSGNLRSAQRALQRVGLVGEVGVSNYSLNRWRAAEQALGARVLSNQVRYSLVDRSPERDLLPFAESTGHLVIAYSPLAQGLLSGRYDRDHRPANRLRAANPLFLQAVRGIGYRLVASP